MSGFQSIIAANFIEGLKKDRKDPAQWSQKQVDWFGRLNDNDKRIFSTPGRDLDGEDDFYRKQDLVNDWHGLR